MNPLPEMTLRKEKDHGVSMKTFRKGEIPPMKNFSFYQKKVKTLAMKIDGPFTVETSEGPLTCQDGYLCMDARNYPYPVATDEFALIYERTEE